MRLANLIRTVPLRLRSIFRRSDVERDLDDELQFHLERQIAQHVTRGMTPAVARAAALAALGGIERRKDDIRDARRVEVVENLRRDIRFAWRALRHNPGYAAVAVITLALGIGATTAIFSVVNGVLLKNLPYADPNRLVTVGYGRGSTVAAGVFLDWKAATRVFSSMGVEEYWTPNLTGTDRPEQWTGVRITPSMLPLLGVQPALGRAFLPDEDQPGHERVVVLAYDTWQSRFAGDSTVLDHTLRLNGESYHVVGVMPRGFRFTPYWASDAGFAAPLVTSTRREDRSGASLRAFARLGPGVTLAQARADLRRAALQLERQYPGTNQNVAVTPLDEEVVGSVRPALTILLGAVALVLLIVCANVAHLQLVRATTRTRELALRAALGASRARVVQQALVESLLLAVIGGVIGLALATVAVRAFVAMAPPNIPRLDEIGMEPGVFAFAVIVATIAGLACGVIPAIKVAHLPSHEALKDGARSGGESRRQLRTRGALIVSEFALALVLLAGAGLLMRSFVALLRVDPGYDTHHALSMQVSLTGTRHEAVANRTAFFNELVERVRQLPGVDAASAINHVPLNGDDWRFPFNVEGQPVAGPGTGPKAEFLVVQPDYFRTMGIQLVRGRDFTHSEVETAEHVMVVNESMAKHFWPGENPVGRRLSVDDPVKHADWFRIVGVARDVRQSAWAHRTDQMYFPYIHDPRVVERPQTLVSFLHPGYVTLVVRTSADSPTMLATIQRVVHELDADAPVSSAITMEAAIDQQFATPRFYVILIGSLALIAAILAGVGIYGVISYSVARRTHEIGIRVALGAQQSEVVLMIVAQAIRLAALGAIFGIVGALALTRYLGSLLYETTPTDPLTFAAVIVALAITATIACLTPARRAITIAPAEALRTL